MAGRQRDRCRGTPQRGGHPSRRTVVRPRPSTYSITSDSTPIRTKPIPPVDDFPFAAVIGDAAIAHRRDLEPLLLHDPDELERNRRRRRWSGRRWRRPGVDRRHRRRRWRRRRGRRRLRLKPERIPLHRPGLGARRLQRLQLDVQIRGVHRCLAAPSRRSRLVRRSRTGAGRCRRPHPARDQRHDGEAQQDQQPRPRPGRSDCLLSCHSRRPGNRWRPSPSPPTPTTSPRPARVPPSRESGTRARSPADG